MYIRREDRETLLGWRYHFHDPIVAIYANFRKRARATCTSGIKARRERSDLLRGKRQRNGDSFIDIDLYVFVLPVTFDISEEKFAQLKHCIHLI